ncbi:hypothetical protein M5689_014374 [Euphorbia peplus]|nr:hypothetical protein M5689_014374 [Euphorbia peplus]
MIRLVLKISPQKVKMLLPVLAPRVLPSQEGTIGDIGSLLIVMQIVQAGGNCKHLLLMCTHLLLHADRSTR